MYILQPFVGNVHMNAQIYVELAQWFSPREGKWVAKAAINGEISFHGVQFEYFVILCHVYIVSSQFLNLF